MENSIKTIKTNMIDRGGVLEFLDSRKIFLLMINDPNYSGWSNHASSILFFPLSTFNQFLLKHLEVK